MVATMNFRVYELGSMNFSVVAHSPRIPLGKQLNVPQPGFSPLFRYLFYDVLIFFEESFYANLFFCDRG